MQTKNYFLLCLMLDHDDSSISGNKSLLFGHAEVEEEIYWVLERFLVLRPFAQGTYIEGQEELKAEGATGKI